MSLNMLVVDDSDVIRQMIARTIGLAQIPVNSIFEASNGREALAILDDQWVDIVLADINMPIMDGAQFVEHLRARPETADLPVIIVSTEGATQRREELAEKGVSAWIRKPFTPEEIRDAVSELTGSLPPVGPAADVLDDVFGRVLEQFAYVYPESVEPSRISDHDGEWVVGELALSGATRGSMTLAAPMELCVEMAANVLGVEGDDEVARLRGADTLGEVLNMTGGHLATACEPDLWSELHPPAVSRLDAAGLKRLREDRWTHAYLVEERPVLLRAAVRASRRA